MKRGLDWIYLPLMTGEQWGNIGIPKYNFRDAYPRIHRCTREECEIFNPELCGGLSNQHGIFG
ncbi:BgTH12-03095 [Blumeria graminis f. sp. triticale]|uniref:BgTH12-03095 n=1 Tax=Blumeria graminis f. sp. triticale TaxID=1689686 RepID=A0A9W4D8U2_BLUGR|nr:BgTH12-03095 [Blumeria graminis f. sp. triticale]